MRDDRHRWAPPGAAEETHVLGEDRLTPVTGLRQTLISGPKVLREAVVGWPEVAEGEGYRLALRRDRVLEINGETRVPGWDADAQCAVSNADTLYAVFVLAGPGAFGLLQRGTEISLTTPSRSVARLFFGLPVLLYRRDDDTYRLHVPSAQSEALVHHLRSADAERRAG